MKFRIKAALTAFFACIALAAPVALAAPAQAAPPDFPFSDLRCAIAVEATLSGNLRYTFVVSEPGNRGPDNLFVQVRNQNRVIAAGEVTKRLPWVYSDRTPNRPGVDFLTLVVWDADTGELCSAYDTTALRRTLLRDVRDLPPIIR